MQERVLALNNSRADLTATFTDLKRLSDEELMELIKQGNHDAFAGLFDRYYRLVLSIALKIIRDRSEAEDLMQEVFFELYQKAEQFDRNKGSAKYWIMRVAYSRSLNRLEYLTTRHFYQSPIVTELWTPSPDKNGTGWNGLTVEEWTQIIHQGLATLNQKQRQTMELACFKGYSFKEIAVIMGETHGNVRNHYYRGLKNLRQFLKKKSCLDGKLISSGEESINVEA